MLSISKIVAQIDAFVWGPVMLVLLVGTGVLLTVRCNFLTWRNLPWALKKTLSKEARTKSRGTGDVSPFSALTTALAGNNRNRKYRRCCNCYGFWWSRSISMDVDICLFWSFF